MCCTTQLNNGELRVFPPPPALVPHLSPSPAGGLGGFLWPSEAPVRNRGDSWSLLHQYFGTSHCSAAGIAPRHSWSPWQHSRGCFPLLCVTESLPLRTQSKMLWLMLIISLFESKEAPNSQQGKCVCCPQLQGCHAGSWPWFTAAPTLILFLGEHWLWHAVSSFYKRWRRKLSCILLVSKTWL